MAELAGMVGTAAGRVAEQGAVSGDAPLTPVQHWFFEQELTGSQQFNQALMLEVRERVDLPLLERALEHLATHHDALRLRYSRAEKGWRQTHAAPGAVPVDWIDLRRCRRTSRPRRWRRRPGNCRRA